MKVEAFAICWNEEKFLPYYLRWYTSFCDKVTIFDNFSTDNSKNIIQSFPRTVYKTYGKKGQLDDDVYLDIKNHCWKQSRSDYVIIGDIDEINYHPSILDYLGTQKRYSIIQPPAFEMVSKKYPTEEKQIFKIIKEGIPRTKNKDVNKRSIFDPQRVREINYHKGCHRSDPEGDINILDLEKCDIKFLHYKWIDSDHVWNRIKVYKKRNILPGGKINNMAYHILTEKEIRDKFDDLYSRREKIL